MNAIHIGISLDQIKDMIHDVRATLLKQKFDKNLRVIDDVFTQPLGAIQIEFIDSSLHSNISSGRYMFRTVREIPPTIDRRNYEGTITRVGPADQLGVKYNLVSYDRALYSGNGRFNKDQIFAFLKDDKMHLISNSGLYHKTVQYIEIRGVVQNPEQAARFADVRGSSLSFSDKAYPISRAMRSTIESIILKERLGIKAQAPEDKVNDGEENVS
ncbi:hypothetical protein LCGC14_1628680 [marine sediment metagenome]|uniref:Uncharacterized protein n=1 Tax=marine sediment metagenome TaxID=412755 RepID=A0A0F9I3N2_9ZZZZ